MSDLLREVMRAQGAELPIDRLLNGTGSACTCTVDPSKTCTMCGGIGHLAKDCSWQPRTIASEWGVCEGFRFIESPFIESPVVILKGRQNGMSVVPRVRRNPMKLNALTLTLRGVFPSLPSSFA